MSFSAGDAFLITDPDFGKQHLRIVLTDPSGSPASVLTVQLNTATSLSDRTTVLVVGDHPFCRWESVVSYDTMLPMDVKLLADLETREKLVLEPMFRHMARLSAELLNRIQHGAFVSPMTTPRMARELRRRLGEG